MKQILLITLLALTTFNCSSQDLLKLYEKNGFKELKLGTDIDNYDFLIEVNEDNLDLFEHKIKGNDYSFSKFQYVVDLDYHKLKTIGDTEVISIYVNVVDDYIYEILVVTDYNYGLFEDAQLVYGEPSFVTEGENLDELSIWTYKNVYCSFISDFTTHQTPDIYKVLYLDLEIMDRINAEKEKEFERLVAKYKEDIVDEF